MSKVPTDAIWNNPPTKSLVMEVCGNGNACWNREYILTPLGDKTIADIQVGDYVFGQNGEPTKVLKVYPQSKKDLYKVRVGDNRTIICSRDHLFTTLHFDCHLNKVVEIVTVGELIEKGKDCNLYFLQNNECINIYKNTNLEIINKALYKYRYTIDQNKLYMIFNYNTYDLRRVQRAFRELGNVSAINIKNNQLQVSMPEQLAEELNLNEIFGKGVKYNKIQSIHTFKIDECTCFTVEAKDGQYIAGETVVTHNNSHPV